MATPNTFTSVVTMAEAAKGIGDRGNMIPVIDILSVGTPLIGDGHWEMSTDFNSYHYAQTMLDVKGTDSVVNQGISWEVPTQAPKTEMIYGLESALKIDSRILSRHPHPEDYKRILMERFLRGLTKSFHDRILYGQTSVGITTTAGSNSQCVGLAPRFQALTPTYDAIQGTQYWPSNVLNAGGSSSLRSAWILKYGVDGVHFPYPKDGQDWVEVDQMPELQLVYDSNSNPFRADVTFFNIKDGLAIGDWRCVQRIANIDGSTHKLTSSLLVQALSGLPYDGMDWGSDIFIYVARAEWNAILQEALGGFSANAPVFHQDVDPWGRKVATFQGIPVKVIDRIVTGETAAS